MYCVECGVKLAEAEQVCPLCRTPVCHPRSGQSREEPLYPRERMPEPGRPSRALPVALTVLWLLGALVVLRCDLQSNGRIDWCGYVIGALGVSYVALALPRWFEKPNPVIFTPCAFAVAAGYLLYICLATGGSWFLPFALPVTGGLGLIVTAFVTLMRYLPRGKLWITAGALILLGGFTVAVELLLGAAFGGAGFAGWSLYPMLALGSLGGYLIFLGICRPAREAMARKFFF